MPRSFLVPLVLVAIMVTAVVSGTRTRSYAQAFAPVPQEFTNSALGAFHVTCARAAVPPCPDPQGSTTWSVDGSNAPNVLRIWTLQGSLLGTAAQSSNNARNLILQPFSPYADWTVTTQLTFPAATANYSYLGQTAGLIVYQDDDDFIYLGRSLQSNGQTQLQFVQEAGGSDLVSTATEPGGYPMVYLQLQKTGGTYVARYSYDNINFIQFAPAVATATPTLTPTVTPTVTGTPTITPTLTPTATVTPLPSSGYTAGYTSPQIGLFAWGGLNSLANTNPVPADFAWFRTGNSLTPGPTAVVSPTSTTAPSVTITSTSTATLTPTATIVPPVTFTPGPSPTATMTATATATATATVVVTPTSTATPAPTSTPVPTPVPTPPVRRTKVVAFQYTSVWYHRVRIGTTEHIQVQAKAHVRQGIWVYVIFATGQHLAFFDNTDNNGFWAKDFVVPDNTISRYSPQAAVLWQLWRGKSTVKSWDTFTVLR